MVDETKPRPRSRLKERLGSVRVRTTVAAVIVVGIALAAASVTMVLLLRRTLTEDVRSASKLRAQAVGDQLRTGSEIVTGGDREEEFVQVLDQNEVVASSENLVGRPVEVDLAPGESRRIDGLPFEDELFLATAFSDEVAGRPLTIIVGRSLEEVGESTAAVVGLLSFGAPLLLIVVGAVTWAIAGRALAPVESIRKEVEAISSQELHRRVPDPPGHDEIAELASTMNRMLSRIETGQLRQRQFVSDASHELRSPVAAIRQHAEVAHAHPDKMSSEELAMAVLDEAARLQRLIEDLLILASVDEGSLRMRKESVDLDDLLFQEAKRIRSLGHLNVETVGVSAGRIQGDRRQLARLVRNLTENASRHARSKVAMGLRNGDDNVVLTVDDDGDGIPIEDRGRIFERFVRLQAARDRDSGGSGLGLAIVAEIAAAHGATVKVEDPVGGGTRVAVSFPSPE